MCRRRGRRLGAVALLLLLLRRSCRPRGIEGACEVSLLFGNRGLGSPDQMKEASN